MSNEMNSRMWVYGIGLILLLGVASCASQKADTDTFPLEENLTTPTRPIWFNTDGRSFLDQDGMALPHMFLDFDPAVRDGDPSINVVIVTARHSQYAYGLDTMSGQRYRKHRYCSQKDVWESYTGTVSTPPFWEGVLPRVFDELGLPQKVILFGELRDRDDHTGLSDGRETPLEEKMRVVGGVIEESCFQGNCLNTNLWEKRLVLVAVNPRDDRMSEIRTLSDLKSHVDWRSVKAFIENADGRNRVSAIDYPGYRLIGELPASDALAQAIRSGKQLNEASIGKIRKACHSLYDRAWNELGMTPELAPKTATKKERSFSFRFLDFYEKFGRDYAKCVELVPTVDRFLDRDRTWFFSYFTGIYKMIKLGYFFQCSSSTWQPNRLIGEGRREISDVKAFSRCTTIELDRSFTAMVTQMKKFQDDHNPYYRFIDYDNGVGGSHAPLFSWVYVPPKTHGCSDSQISLYNTMPAVFPKDIRWEKRAKEIDKQTSIIE